MLAVQGVQKRHAGLCRVVWAARPAAPTSLPAPQPGTPPGFGRPELLAHTLPPPRPARSPLAPHLRVQPRSCRATDAPDEPCRAGPLKSRPANRPGAAGAVPSPRAGGGGPRPERKGKRRAGGRQQPARWRGPAGKRAAPGWVCLSRVPETRPGSRGAGDQRGRLGRSAWTWSATGRRGERSLRPTAALSRGPGPP